MYVMLIFRVGHGVIELNQGEAYHDIVLALFVGAYLWQFKGGDGRRWGVQEKRKKKSDQKKGGWVC